MRRLVLISVFALLFNACAKQENKDVSTREGVSDTIKETSVDQKNEKYKIMFFMNPNGAPCQMQDQILSSIGNDLDSRASVEYIRTTELATARPLFMKYGIRALPSLIVLDKDGNVHHRFTPGIQSAEVILSKIGG